MYNNNYRYSLERYKGRGSRYTCPQCGRKYTFTRYIDNDTNQYINDRVGKCNRLDKCGYHYTPRQYFEDNDKLFVCRCNRVFDKQTKQTTPTTPSIPFTLPEVVAERVNATKCYNFNFISEFIPIFGV